MIMNHGRARRPRSKGGMTPPYRDDAGHLPSESWGGKEAYCMNQPWLTTIDWPLSAVLPAAAK